MIPGKASVSDDVFRNVSVITSWNVHKDEANRLGSIRFANKTSQTLTDFYSEDSLHQVAKLHTDGKCQ